MTGFLHWPGTSKTGSLAFSSGIIFCFYMGQSIAPLRKFFVIYQPFCDRPAPCYAWQDANRISSHLLWFPFFRPPVFSLLLFFFLFSSFSTGNIFVRSNLDPRFSTFRDLSHNVRCSSCSINRYAYIDHEKSSNYPWLDIYFLS